MDAGFELRDFNSIIPRQLAARRFIKKTQRFFVFLFIDSFLEIFPEKYIKSPDVFI